MSRATRVELLRRLYAEQQRARPDDYLAQHGSDTFVRGTEQVFEWYRSWLDGSQRVLDWGCRHAPDSCLLRTTVPDVQIDGCDTVPPGSYEVFHNAAGLRYTKLEHEYEIPYESGQFDAAIGSGVLEHVPMVYESLRELSRVIRPDGYLVLTFLPNRWSLGELRARRSVTDTHRPGQAHHLRTFSVGEVTRLLSFAGFSVAASGYQTHFDLLPLEPSPTGLRRVLSNAGRIAGAARVTPCIALVAQRLSYF